MEYTPRELFLLRLPDGVNIRDELANALLLRAENTILDITGRKSVPQQLIDVQAELAVIFYNKLGAEGESSRSEGGISRSFDELPPIMLKRLMNYPRKVGIPKCVS